ncbi:MAG: DUF5335 family protein [Candidatus Binatia bacterium]
MADREIPRDRWINDLDAFSKQHEGWVVTLEVLGSDLGDQEQATRLPLVGLSADVKAGENRVAVSVGGRPETHLTHFIQAPKRIWVRQSDDPRHDAIEVEDTEGKTTVVHFNHVDPDEVERMLPEH